MRACVCVCVRGDVYCCVRIIDVYLLCVFMQYFLVYCSFFVFFVFFACVCYYWCYFFIFCYLIDDICYMILLLAMVPTEIKTWNFILVYWSQNTSFDNYPPFLNISPDSCKIHYIHWSCWPKWVTGKRLVLPIGF